MNTQIICSIDNCHNKVYSKGLCQGHYNKQYYQDHKEKIKENVNRYYQENREQALEKKRLYHLENKEEHNKTSDQYYQDNKEELKKKFRQYYQEHKEEKKEYDKQYAQDHREERRSYNKRYSQEHREERNERERLRRKNDPDYKVRCYMSSLLYSLLESKNASKNGNSTWSDIIKNYTPEEARQHYENQFEAWMTWENYGVYNAETWDDNNPSTWTWNFDEIIPKSRFKFANDDGTPNIEEIRKCLRLENMRPLSAKQNNQENNRTDEQIEEAQLKMKKYQQKK